MGACTVQGGRVLYITLPLFVNKDGLTTLFYEVGIITADCTQWNSFNITCTINYTLLALVTEKLNWNNIMIDDNHNDECCVVPVFCKEATNSANTGCLAKKVDAQVCNALVKTGLDKPLEIYFLWEAI